jgi:ADP-heptose:LPS heptosyltransferase
LSRAALVLLLPGLGDALAASPLLRGLDADAWRTDVLTWQPPVTEYVSALGIAHNVAELPLRPSATQMLTQVRTLRRRRYDLCVLPFPATRWEYAFVARAAGAKRLAMHRYGGASDAIARGARATLVPLRGGHRIAENLRLARALELTESAQALEYWVPQSWRAQRQAGTLGIHPGSMAYKGNESKRWPYERFVALARGQAERGRRVRFFLGPHEGTEAARAEQDFRGVEGISIVREPLAQAARRLAECEVFVGNDAGFSHLASGLGVKTLALFGMTSEVRGAPVGSTIALRPSLCPACHDEGSHRFECVRRLEYRCILQDVDFDDVSKRIDWLFGVPSVQQELILEGPFRLYGKAYS